MKRQTSVHQWEKDRLSKELHEAIRDGEEKTVIKLLKEYDFLVSEPLCFTGIHNIGVTALQVAAMYNRLDIAKYLISKGAPVNEKERPPLLLAIQDADLDMAKLLISNGAELNYYNYQGTFLYRAVVKGNTEMIELLIVSGADIKKAENSGDLAYLGGAENLKLLIEKGADINKLDRHGNTVLNEVINKCDFKTVKFLIKKGINPELSSHNPLSEAIFKENFGTKKFKESFQIIKLLLEVGAGLGGVFLESFNAETKKLLKKAKKIDKALKDSSENELMTEDIEFTAKRVESILMKKNSEEKKLLLNNLKKNLEGDEKFLELLPSWIKEIENIEEIKVLYLINKESGNQLHKLPKDVVHLIANSISEKLEIKREIKKKLYESKISPEEGALSYLAEVEYLMKLAGFSLENTFENSGEF